jgi:hypothetical protein
LTRRAPSADVVHLRIRTRGRRFGFDVSTDGQSWRSLRPGLLKGPIDETARFALTVGGTRGASAHFLGAALAER